MALLASVGALLATVPTRAADEDVKLLAETPHFVCGPKGEWAETPSAIVAFKNVCLGSDAVKEFRRVYETGTPAGKMYALVGISRLDRALYEKLKAEGEASQNWKDKRRVSVLSGCSLYPASFEYLTKELESGRITGLFPAPLTTVFSEPFFVPAPSFDSVR